LLAVFTIWSISNSAGVIREAKEAGQLVGEGVAYTIVNFYMATCAQYFVFALLLAAMGLLLQRKQPEFSNLDGDVSQDQEFVIINDADDDDEPGEWYDEEAEPETTEEDEEKAEETE